MKASELIEKLAQCIKENGDCEIYTWNPTVINHVPIENIYFIDDEYFNQDLDDEDYTKDFYNIYHNIVIN